MKHNVSKCVEERLNYLHTNSEILLRRINKFRAELLEVKQSLLDYCIGLDIEDDSEIIQTEMLINFKIKYYDIFKAIDMYTSIETIKQNDPE